MAKYFEDKKAAKEKARAQKAAEEEELSDASNLEEKLRKDSVAAKAAEYTSETSSEED